MNSYTEERAYRQLEILRRKVLAHGEDGDKLEEFEQKLARMPRLRLYLAFVPGPKQIEVIGGWARENIDRNVLLDLRLDKSLVAGARIVWQGRSLNYSLSQGLRENHRQIEGLLLHNE